MPSNTFDLAALPDQLLGRVLALAGSSRQDWPAIALTCKRWCNVFFSEPSKWSHFGLGTDWLEELDAAGRQERLAGLERFLQRNAGAVEVFCVLDDNGVLNSAPAGLQLPDFLDLPLPWVLSSLRLWCGSGVPAAAGQRLPRLLGLTHLDLGSWAALPTDVTAEFSRLPHRLQSLRLHMGGIECPELAAVAQLSHLTHLTFDVFTFKASVPLQQLTALQQLRKLWLRETVSERDVPRLVQFPPPARFPNLQDCLYLSGTAVVELDGVASCGFKECYLWTEPAQPQPGQALAAAPAATLELQRIKSEGAARPLLQALLPSSVRLGRLCINSSTLEPAAWAHCSQLTALPALHLNRCRLEGGTDAALEPLLGQASCLTELGLRSCLEPANPQADVGHAELPACLEAKRGLVALYAPGNHLCNLPEAAFLEGIRLVDLCNNSLHHLPPALAQATSLESLRLSDNPQLVLTAADVDATLARLPHLAVLQARSTSTPESTVDQLRGRLPRLDIVTDAGKEHDLLWSQGVQSSVLDDEPFGLYA